MGCSAARKRAQRERGMSIRWGKGARRMSSHAVAQPHAHPSSVTSARPRRGHGGNGRWGGFDEAEYESKDMELSLPIFCDYFLELIHFSHLSMF